MPPKHAVVGPATQSLDRSESQESIQSVLQVLKGKMPTIESHLGRLKPRRSPPPNASNQFGAGLQQPLDQTLSEPDNTTVHQSPTLPPRGSGALASLPPKIVPWFDLNRERIKDKNLITWDKYGITTIQRLTR